VSRRCDACATMRWLSRATITAIALFAATAVPSGAEAPPSTGVCPPPVAQMGTSLTPSVAEPTAASSEPTAASPEQLVACVGSQPITGSSFSHWASIAEKSDPPPKGAPSASHATEVRNEVMAFLISSYWVIGEAQSLAVDVSTRAVRRSFERIRREQFPRRREFADFLKRSGETVADLLFRVRLMLSSERIQQHVLSGHHGARNQANALERFVEMFKAKWRGQTYCTALYAVSDCGHVESSLA